MSFRRQRRGPEGRQEFCPPPRSYQKRSMPGPSIEMSLGALDRVARCGRPDEWLRRGLLAPRSFAWRRGTYRWILSADPWKGAVPRGALARADFRARLPTVCVTAPRLGADAPPSIAFRRAANIGGAPRSRRPAARQLRPGVPADG